MANKTASIRRLALSACLILSLGIWSACAAIPAGGSSRTGSPSTEAGFSLGADATTQASSSTVTQSGERFRGQFLGVFDTVTTVIGLCASEAEFQTYLDLIKNELTRYHQLFDIYNDYPGVTNIKTINDQAGKAPVKVDPAIIELLQQCAEAKRLSQGRVNAAFGPVLKIWHNYRENGLLDPEHAALPSLGELNAANVYTDFSLVQIDAQQQSVFLPDSHMSLDVGSGAKGLACELAARTAEQAGLKNCLLSVGGNVRAVGFRDGQNTPWNVGIQDPDDSTNSKYIRIVKVHDMAVVSSGVYERYYTVDGQRYHHIIHPDTLFPKNDFDAVTIIAPSSGFADSLTTALFNMSFDEGLAFIDGLEDCAALWIKDGQIRYSTRMGAYLDD